MRWVRFCLSRRASMATFYIFNFRRNVYGEGIWSKWCPCNRSVLILGIIELYCFPGHFKENDKMPSSLTAQRNHHRHLLCGLNMSSDLLGIKGKKWRRPSLLPSRVSSLTEKKNFFPFKHLSSYQKVKDKNLKNKTWNIVWKCWDQHC